MREHFVEERKRSLRRQGGEGRPSQNDSCGVHSDQKRSGKGFKALDEMLSPEEKARFRAMSSLDFASNQHFGLGLWIRNHWVCNDDRPMFPSDDADTVSSKLPERYHDHLKRCK